MGEGTEDVKLKFASGSLGEALEAGGGPLAGTTASAGGLKAELVRSEIQPLWDDLDGEQVLRRIAFEQSCIRNTLLAQTGILVTNWLLTYRILRRRKPKFVAIEAGESARKDSVVAQHSA